MKLAQKNSEKQYNVLLVKLNFNLIKINNKKSYVTK